MDLYEYNLYFMGINMFINIRWKSNFIRYIFNLVMNYKVEENSEFNSNPNFEILDLKNYFAYDKQSSVNILFIRIS